MQVWSKLEGVKIFNEDFLKVDIPEDSIDLIVTSPPYNVGIDYNSHNDTISYKEYLDWTGEWLEKAYRLMKSDGRMCLNIPLDKNKGGQQSVYADITTIAKKVGLKYHSTVIWNEGNISRRTAWGSWLSASAPYVIAPVETIVILYKDNWKKHRRGRSDITKNEFIEWTNGLWTFSGESKKKIGHPAPFPVELPRRCIKLFSYVGDTVLDPFLGSGSTAIAAYKLNRKAIGVEIDETYFRLAIKRIMKECIANQNQKKL
jgi:site-specific DNA-methyltransferase (adenine-specific)